MEKDNVINFNSMSLKFPILNNPLNNIATSLISKLKTNPDKLSGLLAFICEVTLETYHAIIYLIDNKNKKKYPLQGDILLRSIIDILFTVVYLLDNPDEHLNDFVKAGLIEWKIDLQNRIESNKRSKIENDYTYGFQFIESTANIFSISYEEISKKNKSYWPLPSRIKDNLSEMNKSFFNKVYSLHYRKASQVNHINWRALCQYSIIQLIQSQDSEKKKNERFESNIAIKSIKFLTMIFSEIQSKIECNLENDLRYVWTLLSKIDMECKEFYTSRYSELLQKKGL